MAEVFNMAIDYSKFLSTPTQPKSRIDYSKFVPTNKETPKKEEPKKPAVKPTIRTVKLNPETGGGEYKTSGPGTLHLTKRSQSAIKTEKGSERDHLMPVSLGGTSSKDNLELKKNTLFGGRQQGKVKVEVEADRLYNKEKKISLPEARLMVMKKNQEIKGLIPKQGTGNYLLPGIKDTTKTFLKEAAGGAKEIFNLGKTILQAPQRAVTSVGLDAINKNSFTSKSKIGKAFLGKEPIISAQTEVATAQKKITDYAKSHGANKLQANALGMIGAPLFVGSMKGMDLSPLGGEKKAIEKSALKIGEELISKKATKQLSLLEKVQANIGTTKKLPSKPPAPGRPIKDNIVSKLRQTLNPLAYQDQNTQKIFRQYNKDILQAQEKANLEASKLPLIGKNKNLDTIINYEKGNPTEGGEMIKKEFDTLYKEGNEKGFKTAYRENYITHVYNNTDEEVTTAMTKYMKDKGVADDVIEEYINGKDLPSDIATSLKLNPSSTKRRTLPDYETAMKYGLTPKYKEPAQLLAHSRMDLEKVAANKKLINSLEFSRRITTEPRPGLEPVNLPFSTQGYFAKPELASMLNGVFRNENKLSFGQTVVSKVGSLSRNIQNIVLSAGIPKSHVNFFTAGQLIKDLTAGNVSSTKAFVRAFSNKASAKWFGKNQELLRDIADEGINMGDRVSNFQNIAKRLSDNKGIKAKVGHIWSKAFDEKTFASYMPQMYAETFKSVQTKALKTGMSKEEARKLAGDTVKSFYGLMENVGRSKTAEDTLSSIFFAPRFREGIIRTLGNTFKSVTTQIKNPAYSKNRKLVAGMILSYAGYDALNKKLNGHHLTENPNGHEFELMIERDNGEVVYVPFMPSFLSVPRNIGSGLLALGKGDVATFTNKMSQNLSMPLKLAGEVFSNRDYFNNPIYSENDSAKLKLQKMAMYIGLGVNHPYVKEIYKTIVEDQPIHQTVTKMLEFPIKYSSVDKISTAKMYEAQDKRTKERANAREIFMPTYNQIQELRKTDEKAATDLLNSLTDEEYEVYKSIAKTEKSKATKQTKSKVYDDYEQIQSLLAEGREDEARQILDSFTDEEYKAYQSIAKSLKDVPK